MRNYIAIDLKSFYASVECVERKLNPLTTNLVVADASRTEKTICLAVSPSLRAYKIPGRARLFQVVQKVKEVNRDRKAHTPARTFVDKSINAEELSKHPEYELDYITAPPRMGLYMSYSTRIFQIYMNYVSPEDIVVYSVDEVFMDVTSYLNTYKMTAEELARKMILDVLEQTGITATAGIGTNLYLCKVAMDIVAKHVEPDENGVRIAYLDEQLYKEQLWSHKPITDFWRVGSGYARKLAQNGMFTMGDVARCSLGKDGDFYNEDLLYKLFGVNAELLIDHAWGYEPTTIDIIKQYKPETNSLSSGQVLTCPYEADKARIVTWEMVDQLVLDLVEKKLVTDQLVLTIGYDVVNLLDHERAEKYRGEVTLDRYGRSVPKHAHGTLRLKERGSSSREILEAAMELYDRIIDPTLLIRRINVAACNLVDETEARRKKQEESFEQLNLFTDYAKREELLKEEEERRQKERALQEAMISVKKKYGKNAILKGTNLQEGATAKTRNGQIGGHKA